MNKAQLWRWVGLIGSLATAAALIAKGQTQEGIGLVFASLSSAGVIGGLKE